MQNELDLFAAIASDLNVSKENIETWQNAVKAQGYSLQQNIQGLSGETYTALLEKDNGYSFTFKFNLQPTMLKKGDKLSCALTWPYSINDSFTEFTIHGVSLIDNTEIEPFGMFEGVKGPFWEQADIYKEFIVDWQPDDPFVGIWLYVNLDPTHYSQENAIKIAQSLRFHIY